MGAPLSTTVDKLIELRLAFARRLMLAGSGIAECAGGFAGEAFTQSGRQVAVGEQSNKKTR